MARDKRLKSSTRRAFGKQRRRPPKRTPKLSQDAAAAECSAIQVDRPRSPSASAARSPDQVCAQPSPAASTSHRIDTRFYTPEENAQRSERASDVKRDIENKSATQRKFDLLDVNFADVDGGAGTDFVVIDMAVLEGLFAKTTCGECGMPVKLTKSARQYGLAVKLELSCTGCDLREARFSSPRVEGAANITPFEVNLRALKGIQSIGKGVTALSDFCACMNLSHRGLHHKTFQGHLRKVVRVCESIAAASEAASVEVVKELYSDLLQPVNNIDVIFDGTWMTRGRSSHIGVGCIIEMYTGLVIDHVVLSNFCLGCSIGPKASEEGYAEWLAEHECQKNIDCSAGRMEVEAALVMFRRSLSRHGLRYTTVLSDGDSRTFHALTEEKVYGFVPIDKKDCLNHVHKRMGAALRNVVEKRKAQGEALGGRGKLTQDKIKKITQYYGYALRSHSHDVPEMKKAVQATLRHMCSTDGAPDHSLCPSGASSWCKYNRAQANNEVPPAHKAPLPDAVRAALEPVFARLSDENLLERCSDGKTQNASECLHSVIWAQTSKNSHASLLSVTRAVAEAVAVFNQGRRKTNESVASGLGYACGNCLTRRSVEKDRQRLLKSNKVFSDSQATRKKLSKRHRLEKSDDYSPGQL